MDAIKFSKLLRVILCLTLFGGVLNSCSPQKTAEACFNEGKTFYENKKYDQAIASYDEAIKLNPKLIKAFNSRGIAYMVKGQFDQAIADFSRAIELDPNYGKAYNNRAVAFWSKGEVAKAQEDINKAQGLGIPINQEKLEQLIKPPVKKN